MASTVRISLARQSCTALAPSVIEPPPTVTMRSALAARACLVAAMTASRGVCARHRVEGRDAARAQRLADFLDFVGLAVERAADHQERAVCAQPVHLLDDRLGGGAAEHHLVHGAEYDTPLVHDDCPPGRLALSRPLRSNLAKLAREGNHKNGWADSGMVVADRSFPGSRPSMHPGMTSLSPTLRSFAPPASSSAMRCHSARTMSFMTQRVLPAVRQLGAVRPGDGVGRRTEFAQEGQHRIGSRALAPGADGVFPPAHEQFDPALVLRKAERDLHLFAAGDPPVNAPGIVENAMDHARD